jgi:hypothetical protein
MKHPKSKAADNRGFAAFKMNTRINREAHSAAGRREHSTQRTRCGANEDVKDSIVGQLLIAIC